MLSEIRNRATGWLAWVIVILITIPFALWGIQSYFEGESAEPVATVNGAEISLYEYQNALSRQRQAMIQEYGSDFAATLLDRPETKSRVLDGLIDEQLLAAYVRDQNYRISDGQLSQLIAANPAFWEDGQFSESLYLDILSANGLSPQSFEESQRQQGTIPQLMTGIVGSAFLTDLERDRLFSLDTQHREAEYVLIEAAQYKDDFRVEDAEIERYYRDNPDRFQVPERMQVDYVELSVAVLSESIEPDEEQIRLTYEQNSERYKQAESRAARHILFEVNSTATEEEKGTIRRKAQSVLQRARSGESFAQLAETFSDDLGSKSNGGDLGVIARGQMVQPFEEAVFAMDQGEVRGLVESHFGFHIIQLTDLKPSQQQTLDEVREQVRLEARKLQAENLFSELAESFQNLVFEYPESLATTADELNLPIFSSDWFSLDQGEGVAADLAVRRAAFSEEVRDEGLVSQAIEIGFDKLIAVQRTEYQPVRIRELNEVRDEIAEILLTEKSRQEAIRQGEQFVATLGPRSNDQSWRDLVEKNQLTLQALPGRRQDVPVELSDLSDAVFSHPVPQAGQIHVGGLELAEGNYAVYALKNVALGDPDSVDEYRKDLLVQQLLDREGPESVQQLIGHLRHHAEVVIAEDRL